MRTFKKVKPRLAGEEVLGLRKGVNYNLINLTPHPISIYDNKNQLIAMIPTDQAIRAKSQDVIVGEFELDLRDSIPIYDVTYTNIDEMPAPQKNTYYIVSNITANALKRMGRTADILVPYRTMRDARNVVIGCKGFTFPE